MPTSKYELPDGSVLTHREVVYETRVNPQTGKNHRVPKKVNGVVQVRIVKGTATMHRGVAVSENGKVFRLIPAHWVDITAPPLVEQNIVTATAE